jgi:hypothetical protein
MYQVLLLFLLAQLQPWSGDLLQTQVIISHAYKGQSSDHNLVKMKKRKKKASLVHTRSYCYSCQSSCDPNAQETCCIPRSS